MLAFVLCVMCIGSLLAMGGMAPRGLSSSLPSWGCIADTMLGWAREIGAASAFASWGSIASSAE